MKNSINKSILPMLLMASCAVDAAQPDRPNVVFIIVDDMGWSDWSCLGSKLNETPNVDRLANEGSGSVRTYVQNCMGSGSVWDRGQCAHMCRIGFTCGAGFPWSHGEKHAYRVLDS